MHVIVDGYNLLGFLGLMISRPGSGEMEAARESLLHDLAQYRQRKGHAVTVVFDGWKQGLSVERQEHRLGLEVIYSRRGEKADRVVQRLAELYGAQAAVVSSDREVSDWARTVGAFVMSAGEFAASLESRSSSSIRPTAAPYSRERMDRERMDKDEGPIARRPDKKGNPRKLPKRLRQRRQQLKRF
jgi:predicted RNA-binding protein with PIN domain